MWTVAGGKVQRRGDDGTSRPASAEEVFQAAFSKHLSSIRSDLPGLSFSRFAAEPALLLRGNAQEFQVVLGVALHGTFFPVEENDDQVLSGSQWIPVRPESYAARDQFISEIGLCTAAGNSLGRLLRIRLAQPPIPIFDEIKRTDQPPGDESPPPDGLCAVPYPYQLRGISFLSQIADQDLGCVLGDEMGLGKTLQVIGLLQREHNFGRANSLVVCPATLLENWRRELLSFAPRLKVLVFSGPGRPGVVAGLSGFDVVLASYETATRDSALLSKVQWNILVVDEAQNIKNPDAIRSREIKSLPRRVSIAVSGTPLENRLKDLWSILDFALPTLLGPIEAFQNLYEESTDGASKLGDATAPVILRRRVSDVAKDLPERIDMPQPILMAPDMAADYDNQRTQALAEFRSGGGLASLMRLKLYCAHASPDLQLSEPANGRKWNRLFELVEEIQEAGQKVLIFCSYHSTSDQIRLEIQSHFNCDQVEQIDGRTPIQARQEIVDKMFGWTGFAALILNPKAAGTGLNITAANHVIHFNPEWNPAVTDQATARAHRRKQQLPVTVHHLFYASTIEEAIMNRSAEKRTLASEAAHGHDYAISNSEIELALDLTPAMQEGE